MAAMYSNQKQQEPLSGLLFASATKQACCTGVTGGDCRWLASRA